MTAQTLVSLPPKWGNWVEFMLPELVMIVIGIQRNDQQDKDLEVGTVAQQANSAPPNAYIPYGHQFMSGYSIPIQLSTKGLGKQKVRVQVLRTLLPRGRPRRSS